MAEFIKLSEFLKPSYEAIKKAADNKQSGNRQKKAGNLLELLESDGAPVAKALIDFLAAAFVDISDGAHCCEYENKFENITIYVNIKRKGTE